MGRLKNLIEFIKYLNETLSIQPKSKLNGASVASLPSHLKEADQEAIRNLNLIIYASILHLIINYCLQLHPLTKKYFGFIYTAEMLIIIAYLILKDRFKRFVTKGARGNGSPKRKSSSSTT